MRQRHYRLNCYRTKDGSRNILTTYIFSYQILNIRFTENATTGGNRIYLCRIHGKLIQFINIHSQYNRHLVNKSARPSCAIAVHTQIGRFGILKEDDFRIFSSDVYHRSHMRIILLYRFRCRNNLLYKRQRTFL